MLRNGRTFYSAFFFSREDLLQRENLKEFLPRESVRWDPKPEIRHVPGYGTATIQHGLYFSEKQYSSDEEFLRTRFDKSRNSFLYNIFVIKYSVPGDEGDLYLVAAPLKQLAGHIFSHLNTHGLSIGMGDVFTFKRVKLTKLLAQLSGFLAKSPRLAVPMIDFYVYGDGGSDDVKISGSDPKKSKVYKALSGLAQAKNESERITMAPCLVVIGMDIKTEMRKTFEIYYKGIFSFRWERDFSHVPDVFFVIHTLHQLGIIENTAVRPTWLTDSTSKRLLKERPGFDQE